jgi:hypothetical protein
MPLADIAPSNWSERLSGLIALIKALFATDDDEETARESQTW